MSQITMVGRNDWAYSLEEVEQLSSKYGNKVMGVSLLILLLLLDGIDIKNGLQFPTTNIIIKTYYLYIVLFLYYVWLLTNYKIVRKEKIKAIIHQEIQKSDKDYIFTAKMKILEDVKSWGLKSPRFSEWNKSTGKVEITAEYPSTGNILKELVDREKIEISERQLENSKANNRRDICFSLSSNNTNYQSLRRKILLDYYFKDYAVFEWLTPWLMVMTVSFVSIFKLFISYCVN